jgi:hypothetical protein
VSHNPFTVRAGVAALLTIAWAGGSCCCRQNIHSLTSSITMPILALEISRGANDIERVLRPGPTEQAEAKDCDLGKKDGARTAMGCERKRRT